MGKAYIYVRVRKNSYEDLTKAIEGLVAIGYHYKPEGWNSLFNKDNDLTFDCVYGYPNGNIEINLLVNIYGAKNLTPVIFAD